MKTILCKNTNHETESLKTMKVTTVLEEKIVLFIALAKILKRERASHHSAFMGSCPTVSYTILSLSAQWVSSPSREYKHGVSRKFHYCFVFGLNQES